MKHTRNHRRRGVLLLETTASIVMIIVLTGALAWSLAEYSRHAESLRTRTRAVAAAEYVLNEIRAGARDDAAAFAGRFNGFAVDVVRTPGDGDWKDMTLVVVRVAQVNEDGGTARPLAELSGYLNESTL